MKNKFDAPKIHENTKKSTRKKKELKKQAENAQKRRNNLNVRLQNQCISRES
jgi:hypothetical protein